MTEQLKGLLIETLTYFKSGLDDIEAGSEERQPMQDEVDFALELVKKLIIADVSQQRELLEAYQHFIDWNEEHDRRADTMQRIDAFIASNCG